MPETAGHKLPYPTEELAADVPKDIKALAEKVNSELDLIAPKQITGVAKKQLLIANSSGVVTAVTASGDVTNDEAGVFTVGDGKITSQKMKPTVGVKASSGDLTLTTSYQDVPGAALSITPVVASTLKVTAIFEFGPEGGASGEMLGTLRLDAEDQSRVARGGAASIGEKGTYSQIYALALTAAPHTIKMRAKRVGASGACLAAGTAFLFELVAS